MKKSLLFLLLFALFPLLAETEKETDPLREKASSGDPEAAFKLGNDYYYGENGRKKNTHLAAHWYLQAAKKDVPEGMYNYAVCLEQLSETPGDKFKAFQWYQKAAEKNFDPARFRIAGFYSQGLKEENGKVLIRKSPASALEQLEILNSRDYEPGELLLASLLLQPGIPPARQARAYGILTKVCARKQYSPAALRMLADCHYGGIGCEKDPEKAFRYLTSASERGDAEAMAKLGYLYEHGEFGVKKDREKAFQCYRAAAGKQHAMGLYKYGEALFDGVLKEEGKDGKEAIKLLRTSASLGCVQAMYKLGTIYESGLGGEEANAGIAARCYYEAARLGFAPAQYKFGEFFAEGKGVRTQDDGAAFYWFRQAAVQGHPAALRCAGIAMLEGKGTDRSRTGGLRLLQEAAKKGDVTAIRLLETMR
ncbi:MAG: sel1 repeat family protein [Lentisphaeria bacterium]|nr:sel1 repeat family protein [Lentisphaeria bacterium]